MATRYTRDHEWVRLEHGAIVVLNAEMLRELAEAGSGEGEAGAK